MGFSSFSIVTFALTYQLNNMAITCLILKKTILVHIASAKMHFENQIVSQK
jgi:hypothetical protein